MTNPIPAVQHASVYRPTTGRETTCKHANNPYGHNPECVCGWARPPQIVPYLEEIEEPEPECPPSKHARWWPA